MLFLLAIALPCAVIVALGLLLMSQERELAEKRLAEERRSHLVQFGRELIVRLERIKLEEAAALAARTDPAQPGGHPDPAAALFATLEGGRLVLPWEADPALKDARGLLGEFGFARKVAQGECEELACASPKPRLRGLGSDPACPALRADSNCTGMPPAGPSGRRPKRRVCADVAATSPAG